MSDQPDKPLYHYTTAKALLSILRTGVLRATNLHYMNDTRELRAALALFAKHARSMERQIAAPARDRWHQLCEQTSEQSCPDVMHSFYAAAFSENWNDLPQWRAYGAVGGVCIEVDAQRIADLAAAQGFAMYRCVYGDDPRHSGLDALLARVKELIEDVPEPHAEKTIRSCIADAKQQLFEWCVKLKDKSFSDESEWRLVYPSPGIPLALKRVEHYLRRAAIVPYCPLRLRDENGVWAITRITVGPGADQTLSHFGIRSLARRHGAPDNIDVSDIPFRG